MLMLKPNMRNKLTCPGMRSHFLAILAFPFPYHLSGKYKPFLEVKGSALQVAC